MASFSHFANVVQNGAPWCETEHFGTPARPDRAHSRGLWPAGLFLLLSALRARRNWRASRSADSLKLKAFQSARAARRARLARSA